jgi:hypothetical protein
MYIPVVPNIRCAGFYVVTPLEDQRGFNRTDWGPLVTGVGAAYNSKAA